MKFIVIVSLLASAFADIPKKGPLNASAPRKPHPTIVQGSEVKPHSIPWQVYIQVTEGLKEQTAWTCGGALISPNYVLTSAYCADGAVTGTVLLGAHNVNEEEETQLVLDIKKYIPHPEYDEDYLANNIGLLELAAPVKETSAIKYALILETNDLVHKIAKTSGWGRTNVDSDVGSSVLLAYDDIIISNDECSEEYDIITDATLCLSGVRGNICNGDSGDPLTVHDKIVGVASFASEFCTDWPSGFTNVIVYLDWIKKNSDY